MTEALFHPQTNQLNRNYIIALLEQLTIDYKTAGQDRKQIAAIPSSEEEFNLLEEVELLTVEIRGYASQIKTRGWIENPQLAIDRLQYLRFFEIPAIAHFFLNANKNYPQMKAYIRMLDYLRLLLLESLHSQLSNLVM